MVPWQAGYSCFPWSGTAFAFEERIVIAMLSLCHLSHIDNSLTAARVMGHGFSPPLLRQDGNDQIRASNRRAQICSHVSVISISSLVSTITRYAPASTVLRGPIAYNRLDELLDLGVCL